jgi:hypothetical protein
MSMRAERVSWTLRASSTQRPGVAMNAGRTARGIPQVPCCLACGARDVEVSRLGWAEGVRDRLGSGGSWRPPW